VEARVRLPAWISCVVLVFAVSNGAPEVVRALQEQTATSTPNQPSISRAGAASDLETLFRAIENVHPHPYDIVPRESIQAERQRVEAGLPDMMTQEELWIRMSPLVVSLGDGHTGLSYPTGPVMDPFLRWLVEQRAPNKDVALRLAKAYRVVTFPPRILGLDGDGHLVITSTDGGGTDLRRGERLVSINGRNADELLTEWSRETNGDSQAHRAVRVADDFHYLLLIHSMLPPYAVVVAVPDGRERTVMLAGVPLTPAEAMGNRPDPIESFSYRTLESGVGYMDFHSMTGNEGAFKSALARMFRQVAADSVHTVIVDLRRNEGGNEDFGNELLRYVTTKPYRNWGGRELKRSAEFRDFAKSEYFPAAIRWLPIQYLIADGRKVWTGPVGTLATWPGPPLKTPKRAEPFFAGPVCLLTGPRTFSAAVIFADTVKTHRLATIVGEETGGHPNMYSAQYVFALPKSRLVAQISAAHNIRANGDESDRNGVLPDIAVSTTAADIRDGRDPVIERAQQCPTVQ
jgi:Peptidase family S41